MKFFIKSLLTLLIALLSTQTFSQQLIPFQARLTDGVGAVVPDGVYAVNFNIYDAATAGTALWTETHASVSVMSGVVNVILGSITPLNDPDNDGDLSDAVTFYNTDGNRFIGVTIGTGQEMVPRHQLVPSFHAATAENSVTAENALIAEDASKFGGNLPSYYATNSDLLALGGQMTGMISAFSNVCPTGWLLADGTSGTPDLRNRFLRGESTGNPASLDFAGNDDATLVSHNHSINPPNTDTSTNGNHNHTSQMYGAFGADDPLGIVRDHVPHLSNGDLNGLLNTNNAGNHVHSVDIPAFNSSLVGSPATNANIPGYYEVIYCVKQ